MWMQNELVYGAAVMVVIEQRMVWQEEVIYLQQAWIYTEVHNWNDEVPEFWYLKLLFY